MADRVRGQVADVIDGDTFDMEITKVGTNNVENYGKNERIRIAGIDAPELNREKGKRAKEALEREIARREIECIIQARDEYGRLVADVYTNPPKV